MIEVTRLLGFAFASADFLFEIDRGGKILFVAGATSGLKQDAPLYGSYAAEIFAENERARFNTIVRGMSPGDRVGPLRMPLSGGGEIDLSMCHLPQNGENISCTLVSPGNRNRLSSGSDAKTGLPDRDSFLAAVATNVGANANMALVNVPALPGACAGLSESDANALLKHIGNSVKAMGAVAAGRISQSGFGVVSADPAAAKTLADRIQTAVRERGLAHLDVEEHLISLKTKGLTPEQTMLAVKHVVGRFADNKLTSTPGDLAQAFDTMITETIERAQALNVTVSEGAFDLVFEPVVELPTHNTSHYEVLTRFQPGQSPGETVRFAEEMGISDGFDLSVALKTIVLLEQGQNPDVALAINVSGHTISNPTSFAMYAGLLARKRVLAKRLLIEVTETAEISDLTNADKAIQALRELGYRVGIDDLGAGAASLQYFQSLSVDFVKVDGALIKKLGHSTREDSVVVNILRTCLENKIKTVAEWVEDKEKMKLCRQMGFDLGQGRYYGETLSELPRPTPSRPVIARRAGVQESWR